MSTERFSLIASFISHVYLLLKQSNVKRHAFFGSNMRRCQNGISEQDLQILGKKCEKVIQKNIFFLRLISNLNPEVEDKLRFLQKNDTTVTSWHHIHSQKSSITTDAIIRNRNIHEERGEIRKQNSEFTAGIGTRNCQYTSRIL